MSKYRNRKTELDGIVFDSQAEARRWAQLRLLERAGDIQGLQRQVSFELVPGVKFEGEKRAKPALRYVADFAYSQWLDGKRWHIVEDTKGVQTALFRCKRHLMKHLFNIDIRIVK